MSRAARAAGLFQALSPSARGMIWMTLSTMFYASTYATARHLADSFDILQIVFFRSVLGVVFMLPWLMRVGIGALRTRRFGLYGARIGLNYVGMVCLMYGIANLPLQDVTALMFTVPLFTVLSVALLLGERVGVARWCALAVGFAGTLVIIRPGFVAVGVATLGVLLTCACYALTNTATKSLGRTENPNVIVFYVFLLMGLIGAGPAAWTWVNPGWGDLPWIVAIGAFSSLATVCVTRALIVAEAGVVMPFNFLKLPFIVVLGLVFFAERPDLWTMVGAVIIFSSTWYIARREARMSALRQARA